VKVSIQVAVGSNEAIVVESELKDPSQWAERIAPVFAHLEARVGDRSRRIMAGSEKLRELAAHDPVLAEHVKNLVLVCLGQMPTVTTEGLVEKQLNLPLLERVEEPA
jgi:hypothetical protein